ncbi:2-amino-4-hydroxy-6-hydroxymethyldihydropteridine diphosphokinase [Leeia sp. TBRC 13508]|uniref:2-amino-4-hydroxy-6-hydroxymethyldihydropteridine pyrophosphokinase n=1 Tax=Leeia speluncae TaxID=2884804 RepID=A0ABS8D833_9NEIS|nr:2-amino-4-hydroxy-6-hydroxymethyldihydropteridine diphosphokinase [Leeia speluncae]MCB6184136.1 2-amino-4-hydroxy-6-hydroxymethyldihydropteridine diphosphokinase [Leeia speluncae]
MARAYIALGGNLGDPVAQMQTALTKLSEHPAIHQVRASRYYVTAPVGYDNQPDFYNAVAEVETTLAANELLDLMFELEFEGGRERLFANAPRTLDLDLLMYDQLVSSDPRMILPHPRMHLRAFVLVPLAELAPTLEMPGIGALTPWLAACQDQRIEARQPFFPLPIAS